MSAIGSYAVLRRAAFSECVERAKGIRTETSGWWLFKSTRVVGMQEFEAAWANALVEAVSFGHSGYLLGNYLDAQEQINSLGNRYEYSDSALALTKAFTAAIPFELKESFPELAQEKLLAWCREEYGKDANNMAEALKAAHTFYQEGLARIDDELVVVFIIN